MWGKIMRLSGKVAFITGSGSGIGQAAAILFAQEGAKVAVAELTPTAGEETVRRIEAAGGEAAFIDTDVTRPESVAAAMEETVRTFGRLNVIYNNAGGSTPNDGPVTEAPIDEFWRAIRVDLFGTWIACKYGIPYLVAAGGGSVINTASMVAIMGLAGFDAYTPAKGGIIALTRSMAVEFGSAGIRVNAIAPGMVATERGKKSVAAGRTPGFLLERQLLGFVEPIEIANTALFLASDESRPITGQTIRVDSGITIT
jgi:NAD(P)-dependent dehydrogenase (short-subunit alcohol dehydrogenase family)